MSEATRAASEMNRRTVRTGRAANGSKVREERWPEGNVVWNKTEGRNATDEEVRTTTWNV